MGKSNDKDKGCDIREYITKEIWENPRTKDVILENMIKKETWEIQQQRM